MTWSNLANDRVSLLSGTTVVSEITTAGATSGSVTFPTGLATVGTLLGRRSRRCRHEHDDRHAQRKLLGHRLSRQPDRGGCDDHQRGGVDRIPDGHVDLGQLRICAHQENPITFSCLTRVGSFFVNTNTPSDTPVHAPRLALIDSTCTIAPYPDLPDLAKIGGSLTLDTTSGFSSYYGSTADLLRLTTLGGLTIPLPNGDGPKVTGLSHLRRITGDRTASDQFGIGRHESLGLSSLLEVDGNVTNDPPLAGLEGLLWIG